MISEYQNRVNIPCTVINIGLTSEIFETISDHQNSELQYGTWTTDGIDIAKYLKLVTKNLT